LTWAQRCSNTYNEANEQEIAQASDTGVTWQYVYDGNGNLVQSMPGNSPANGASRYTYNTAGFLVKVESHDDSGWNTQAEMAYDGLGERLSMTSYSDGQSVTTQYELDGGLVLSATAGDLTTTYLYGLGPIGELTDSWAYTLPDGSNAPRQLVDASGKITLASSYTPWGDTLAVNGTGNFTWGYYGGIMDTATGLLYVGNGQYYDPSTGRFLNRNARPDQTNPYVPWKQDPSSALMAPLAILALVYSRKKKHGKWDGLIVSIVLVMAIGMSLSACGSNQPKPPEATVTMTVAPGTTTVTAKAGTWEGTRAFATDTPVGTPTSTQITCFGGSGSGGRSGSGDQSNGISLLDSYLQGCQNFGSAWSIYRNPDASYGDRFIAGVYMGAWGGAHATLAVGVAGLACVAAGPGCVAAAEAILGIGGGVDAACGGDFCAIEVQNTVSSIEQGVSVIGRYPDNKILAQSIGGSYLDVPLAIWNSLTSAEQWALNKEWLQDAIIRGDVFQLASDFSRAEPGTGFANELNYLIELGYTITTNSSYLIPPIP
jgi:RHS repeat-associated protein